MSRLPSEEIRTDYHIHDVDLEEAFYNCISVPRLCTYKDLSEWGFGTRDYTDHNLCLFVEALLRDIEHEWEPGNLISTKQNQTKAFHALKIGYLINEIKTTGLYSPIQGLYKRPFTHFKAPKLPSTQGIYIHPGTARVYAIRQTRKFDEPVIIWDNTGEFSRFKELNFNEWLSMFKTESLARNISNIIIEMHADESIRGILDTSKEIRDSYLRSKPILRGDVRYNIRELFDFSGETGGVIVETKGTYVFSFEDLRYFLELHPQNNKIIDTENFTISINNSK